jgi:hypothetical protein
MATKSEKMDDFMNGNEQKEVAAPREKKRAPNRLMVEESHGEGDNSVIMMSEAKMEGT